MHVKIVLYFPKARDGLQGCPLVWGEVLGPPRVPTGSGPIPRSGTAKKSNFRICRNFRHSRTLLGPVIPERCVLAGKPSRTLTRPA